MGYFLGFGEGYIVRLTYLFYFGCLGSLDCFGFFGDLGYSTSLGSLDYLGYIDSCGVLVALGDLGSFAGLGDLDTLGYFGFFNIGFYLCNSTFVEHFDGKIIVFKR